MERPIKKASVECKCCKKKFKSNRILQHLKSGPKRNCISEYSEAELTCLKQEAKQRTAFLQKQWKNKHKEYYSKQRADQYQLNKYKLSKKSSEYYAKNKDKIKSRKSQYYIKRKEKEDQELSKRREELEKEYESRLIKSDMPKFKDWHTERARYYLDQAKWRLSKNWKRWMNNLSNFRKKGLDTDSDERLKSLPKLEDYCSEIEKDLSKVVNQAMDEDLVDYDVVDEMFQWLIDKIKSEEKIFEKKIGTIMRDIGNQLGVKVICGLHEFNDSYTKDLCDLCKDGFFVKQRKDSKNKEYSMKRTSINFTLEDLEQDVDEEDDEEFKSKDPNDGYPRTTDRNLCRPYNFRVKKKYANDSFLCKTPTTLEKYSGEHSE